MADYERKASGLRLDRIAVEEVGGGPERLAQAIHDQLGARPGPVPVRAIAAALNIGEIRAEPLPKMEGALVALQERGDGSILVNSRSSPRRQRFTIGHELGHFLNVWHEPTEGMFTCSKEDMRLGDRPAGLPDQASVPGDPGQCVCDCLAEELDISREATIRRYVELHRRDLAVVFSQHDRVLYFSCEREFPGLSIGPGSPLPQLPSTSPGRSLSEMEEVDGADWLRRPVSRTTSKPDRRPRRGLGGAAAQAGAHPGEHRQSQADPSTGRAHRRL